MTNDVTGTEARAALDAIDRSRREVVDEIDMPQWYWWGLALGWIALGVVTDVANPWLATVAAFVFATVHAAVAQLVVGGRHRTTQLSVRADVVGRRAPLLVVAGLVGLGLLTIAGGWALTIDGADHPVTTASIVVAVLIVLGGPRLMAAIRERAAQSDTLP